MDEFDEWDYEYFTLDDDEDEDWLFNPTSKVKVYSKKTRRYSKIRAMNHRSS
jgi:hypothetical protein